jgi:hypothetical protein
MRGVTVWKRTRSRRTCTSSGLRTSAASSALEKRLGEYSSSSPSRPSSVRRGHRRLYTWYNMASISGCRCSRSACISGVGMSICAGYHRFFSHKSYEASRPVQVFYAFFGAMAAQNSILWWSSAIACTTSTSTRTGIRTTSSAASGGRTSSGSSTMNPRRHFDNAPDLLAQSGRDVAAPLAQGDPHRRRLRPADAHRRRVRRSDRGLLWGGFLRIVVIHHTTFFVNSLAHTSASRKYNAEVSARDNWLVALLTLGEGYHSFHHRFPADFRNGIRWYHWDPAKWFIARCARVGLATGLRSPPTAADRAGAHARREFRVSSRRWPAFRARSRDELRRRLHTVACRASRESARALAPARSRSGRRRSRNRWRATRRRSRRHVRQSRRHWKRAVRAAGGVTSIVASPSRLRVFA